MRRSLILIVALIWATGLRAEITMSPLFSDNMILQQNSSAPIWGQSSVMDAMVVVTPSWSGHGVEAKADSRGLWNLNLDTPSYGGPYTITISDGSSTHTIENVLVGEVWIASGQSNMEMQMRGFSGQPVAGGNRDIALSADSNLRIMTIERSSSAEPQTEINSSGWAEATPEIVAGSSATAYYFARMLRSSLDIPVGILCTSWGGTSIDCWLDSPTASKYIDIAERDKSREADHYRHSSAIFNAMINPIVGYAAQGFIWYQGETDRPYYTNYRDKFVDMVALWRGLWGDTQSQMGFYYAQIAPYDYVEYRSETEDNTPYIREAQVEALGLIPNSGMACLSDAGEQALIHPSRKYLAGERLAYQALLKEYDVKGIVADGPLYSSMEIVGSEIHLSFDNAELGLSTFGKELSDFEIAGVDGNFVAAKATIDGKVVVVSSSEVSNPKSVRYGFHGWFDGSLYNNAELPASSFRTDK